MLGIGGTRIRRRTSPRSILQPGQPKMTGMTVWWPLSSVVVMTVFHVMSFLAMMLVVNPGGEVVMVPVTPGSERQSGSNLFWEQMVKAPISEDGEGSLGGCGHNGSVK